MSSLCVALPLILVWNMTLFRTLSTELTPTCKVSVTTGGFGHKQLLNIAYYPVVKHMDVVVALEDVEDRSRMTFN